MISCMSKEYKKLGHILLNDDDGAIVDQITNDYHYKSQDIVLEIIKRWLRGKGKEPVSWRSLIEALNNLEMMELATHMEGALC